MKEIVVFFGLRARLSFYLYEFEINFAQKHILTIFTARALVEGFNIIF